MIHLAANLEDWGPALRAAARQRYLRELFGSGLGAEVERVIRADTRGIEVLG